MDKKYGIALGIGAVAMITGAILLSKKAEGGGGNGGETGTAVVTVYVMDYESGFPLDGALITISGPSTREGTTNSAGQCVFANMAAGTYMVTCSLEGYIAQTIGPITIPEEAHPFWTFELSPL